MIISCTKCGAKFNVSDDAIGADGRLLRCSACSHEWFHEGIAQPTANLSTSIKAHVEPVVEKPEDIAPIKFDRLARNKPVVSTPIYQRPVILMLINIISFIAFLGLLFILTITYRANIIEEFPAIKNVFNALHMQDSDGLKFDVVNCTLSKDSELDTTTETVELQIKVIIKNTGAEEQKLDAIRFSIYTKDKDFLGEYVMNLNKMITANAEETIEGKLNRIPKDVTFVIIEMGNSFDIAVRRQKDVLNYHEEK